MNNSGVSKTLAALVLLLGTGASAFAQFGAESPAGVSAGLAKLFGNITAFAAKADVQVLDTNRQETLRTPMGFAYLDNKMRLEIDAAQMKGKSAPPAVVAGLKQAGLDRIVSIVRLDKKMVYLVFTSSRNYVATALSGTDAEAAQKNLQIRKTPLGTETLDGHPCSRNKVVVRNSKGVTLLEATTWNATDLKEFPLQIAVQGKDSTTLVHFTQVQFVRPPAAQFEPPAGYAKYHSMDTLLLAAAQKQKPAPKAPASRPPKAVEPKTATTRK